MENCIKFDNMGMINEGLQFDFIEHLLCNILFLYHIFFDPLDGKNHPSFFYAEPTSPNQIFLCRDP